MKNGKNLSQIELAIIYDLLNERKRELQKLLRVDIDGKHFITTKMDLNLVISILDNLDN